MRNLLLSLALTAALATSARTASQASGGGFVALKAGSAHLVDGGGVLTGGVTILVRDDRIEAVGKNIDIPPDARVVDYGPDAVIVPGLIAATSSYGMPVPRFPGEIVDSPRTADFGVRAVDNLDLFSRESLEDLSAGVTAAYIAPTNRRLIGGQGAVIKLAGDSLEQRLVRDAVAIDGSISDEARNAPGYWKPPVPATADVGLGLQQRQLPQTAMGAIVALREIVDIVRGGPDSGIYGPSIAGEGRALWQAQTPWRIDAESSYEIRALLAFAQQSNVPLVLNGGREADALAAELAGANVPVIFEVDMQPNSGGRDLGRGDEVPWPRYDVCAKLAEQGVKLAITPSLAMRPRNIRYAAALASRGGLSAELALRAITLAPAEMLGVSQRLGSITVGKDADFCVLNGAPMLATSSVLATWISGDERWNSARDGVVDPNTRAKAAGAFGADALRESARLPGPVVIEVEHLYLGDGQILSPGQVLLDKGRIVEVSARVSHPGGAQVVRGFAAMPGMIDSFGHLGLEGSQRTPDVDFQFSRIVESGDSTDRRVAKAGITTVLLSPRGQNPAGVSLMAYKPAGDNLETMIVEDPAAMRMMWSDRNRLESGRVVRDTLAKAVEYKKKWDAYEEAKAKWVPPPPVATQTAAAEKPADDKDKKAEEAKDGEKKEEKKDDKKKEEEGDPVNGIWEVKLIVPPYTEASNFRLRLEHDGEKLSGSLRCDPLSSTLIELTGTYTEKEKEAPKDAKKAAADDKKKEEAEKKPAGDAKPEEGEKKDEAKKEEPKKKGKEPPKERKFTASGQGSRGEVSLSGEFKDGKLDGKLLLGETAVAFVLERTSKELDYARRPERRKPKEGPKAEPVKGEPRAPGIDARLEGLRQAMLGKRALLVDVERDDEILDCVAAFEAAGIRPILFGASDAGKLAAKLRGRVAGVLLSPALLSVDPKLGLSSLTNRYAQLAAAGIAIGFKSEAEEGAAELPLFASYAVSQGLSADVALRALTSGAADMLRIDDRVGRLAAGLDGDVLLIDGPPLEPATSVLRAWVAGKEVH